MCEFRENPLEGFRELTVLNWTPFMKIVYSERAQARVWGSPRLEFWLLCLSGEWSRASHRMVLSLNSSSKIPPSNLVGIEWLMQMSGTILITDLMLNKFYSFSWILPFHSARGSYSPPPLPSIQTIWGCSREKPILTPCWNCFSELDFLL